MSFSLNRFVINTARDIFGIIIYSVTPLVLRFSCKLFPRLYFLQLNNLAYFVFMSSYLTMSALKAHLATFFFCFLKYTKLCKRFKVEEINQKTSLKFKWTLFIGIGEIFRGNDEENVSWIFLFQLERKKDKETELSWSNKELLIYLWR